MKGNLCILSPLTHLFVQKVLFKLPATSGYHSRHWESALNITHKVSVLVELNSGAGGVSLTKGVPGAKEEHGWRPGDSSGTLSPAL